jgi:hypothetical protein
MPANPQHHRAMACSASATTNKYLDEHDDVSPSNPSLTKVYMNKSFALRRQRSNVTPSTSKPLNPQQQQPSTSKPLLTRQVLKSAASVPSQALLSPTINTTTGQTNRAVELRRARAQAKIEELAQRTRHQLQKTDHHNDMMSASWHSNASSSSTSKKNPFHVKSVVRSTNGHVQTQKQDMLKTRTISASSHHRSSSASPNPLIDTKTSTRYRKMMVSSVTDEQQYHKMNGSTCSEEVHRTLIDDIDVFFSVC